MPDARIQNEHIIAYRCGTYAPDDIRQSLLNFAEVAGLDQKFFVSAVRNIKNVYTEKGFIYTTTKNFNFLKNVIEGKDEVYDKEDVFSFEDEYGFPMSYETYVGNVYEMGDSNYPNKLFCRNVPRGVDEKYLKEVFGQFATKKTKTIKKGTETLRFPHIKLSETHNGDRTATVIYEDSTNDACYAYIMARRLDLPGEGNRNLIFSPFIHRKDNGWSQRGRQRRRR